MKKIATLMFCAAAIIMLWQGLPFSFYSRVKAEDSKNIDSEMKNLQPSDKVQEHKESVYAKKEGRSGKQGQTSGVLFEKAVEIIKKYEGLHQPKHWPLVGYGHLVLKGERFNRSKTMSEKEAEALLRKDLLKNCAVFREFGKDSLILGVLAYNIGSGNVKRSSVVQKLRQGNRDIKQNFLAHCRYRGKEHPQLKRRRIEEFESLFLQEKKDSVSTSVMAMQR